MQSLNAADQARRAKLAATVRAHRAGHLRQAVAGYEALLRRTPDDADVLQLLGVALAQSGRCADAVVFLARSLELTPDRPTVLLSLAQALHTLGREEEALQACNRALALDASLAGGYRTRAAAFTALGRREEALANAGQAVRLARTDPGAHADLGVALEAVGREREALQCFERAVALDPNLAAAIRPLPRHAPTDPDMIAADRSRRWDDASVHIFEGTYGDYLMRKVAKVFPELGARVLPR